MTSWVGRGECGLRGVKFIVPHPYSFELSLLWLVNLTFWNPKRSALRAGIGSWRSSRTFVNRIDLLLIEFRSWKAGSFTGASEEMWEPSCSDKCLFFQTKLCYSSIKTHLSPNGEQTWWSMAKHCRCSSTLQLFNSTSVVHHLHRMQRFYWLMQ